MATILIELPDGVFAALRRSPNELAHEMRRAAAIHWYSQGLISQGTAAALAGLTRTDFLYALAQAKADAFQIDAAELKEDVERDLQGRRERLSAHLPDAGQIA